MTRAIFPIAPVAHSPALASIFVPSKSVACRSVSDTTRSSELGRVIRTLMETEPPKKRSVDVGDTRKLESSELAHFWVAYVSGSHTYLHA